MLRILHVLNHSYRYNGNVHAAVDVACAQAQLGHDVALCSRGGSFDDVLRGSNVEIFEIDHDRKPMTLIAAEFKLARLIRRWRPDVIHAHMMTSAMVLWPLTRLFRTPLVTTTHNAHEPGSIIMGLGDRVIAVSAAGSKSMSTRGISAGKLRTILNGTIGAARLAGPMPPPQILSHPAVVFVGGIHPRKGVPDLIEAFDLAWQTCPEASLYLVGEGPNEAEYQQKVSSLSSRDAIHFCGSHVDPRPFLQAADIFVLASHFDPAPLVLSEAREAGCAIIGTDIDGIPELLDHGEAGILVPSAQPKALAEQLIRLLQHPDQLNDYRRRSLTNLARLSVRRVASDTIEIYRELTKGAPLARTNTS